MRAKQDLGDQPRSAAGDEQRSLEVVARVIEELDLLRQGDARRPHDGDKPAAYVVAVTLRPAHALAGKAPEGGHALGG